jgi:hypothetical protein
VAFFLMAGLLMIRYPLGPLVPQPARDRWLTPLGRVVAFGLLLVLTFPAAGHPALDLIAAAGASLLWLTVLVRFGFLAAVTATVVSWVLAGHPLALQTSGWPVFGIWLPLLAVAAVLAWGCLAAMGRVPSWRKWVGQGRFEPRLG